MTFPSSHVLRLRCPAFDHVIAGRCRGTLLQRSLWSSSSQMYIEEVAFESACCVQTFYTRLDGHRRVTLAGQLFLGIPPKLVIHLLLQLSASVASVK